MGKGTSSPLGWVLVVLGNPRQSLICLQDRQCLAEELKRLVAHKLTDTRTKSVYITYHFYCYIKLQEIRETESKLILECTGYPWN
jgi:hypothetical protein